MRWFQGFIAALLFGLLPPGWARAVELPHPDSITISDAWAEFITARAESATAHVTVNNHGLAPDRLESALSPVARHVELRREGAASSTPTMIGAGATRELALSLTGIDQRLTLNKRFPLVLIFEHAGVIRVDIPLARFRFVSVEKPPARPVPTLSGGPNRGQRLMPDSAVTAASRIVSRGGSGPAPIHVPTATRQEQPFARSQRATSSRVSEGYGKSAGIWRKSHGESIRRCEIG